jgi:hypothetical protein
MVLRRIFGAERAIVTGGWRKLHNEELDNLYTSPGIISDQIKEDEMGGACGVHGRDEKCKMESLKGRDHLEGLGIDERVVLKRVWVCELYSSGSG